MPRPRARPRALPEGHGGSRDGRCQGLPPRSRRSRQAGPAPGKSAASDPEPGGAVRAGPAVPPAAFGSTAPEVSASPKPEPVAMRAQPCRAVPGSAGRGGAGPRCRAP